MNEPRLVLGAMYFGTRLDDRASFALLDRFVAAGGRWIDTANCYSFWEDPSGLGGQSEEVIGRWLRANPGPVRTEFAEVAEVEPKLAAAFQRLAAEPGPVVAAGLAGLSANRAIVIPGTINKVGAQGARLLPRTLMRRLAGALK